MSLYFELTLIKNSITYGHFASAVIPSLRLILLDKKDGAQAKQFRLEWSLDILDFLQFPNNMLKVKLGNDAPKYVANAVLRLEADLARVKTRMWIAAIKYT